MFSSALSNYGERVLREVESVASSQAAIRNIRVKFDPDWAKQRVGTWLETFFDHDYVFVFDAAGQSDLFAGRRRTAEPAWFDSAQPDLTARARLHARTRTDLA